MARTIFNESLKHGDLIVSSYPDYYKKLTYKVLSGYGWARKFCPSARFVGKLDDDILFNYPRLPLFLRDNNFTWPASRDFTSTLEMSRREDADENVNEDEELPMAVLGPQNPNFKVVRNPGSKWCV